MSIIPDPRDPDALGSPQAVPSLERRHNLPAPLTSFIGRVRDLAEVRRLLAARRLLTLVGPGGVGKSRLALEAAAGALAMFAGGIWFVDLSTISDPLLILQAIASPLWVSEEPGRPLLTTLSSAIGERELLLLLDTCEHLVDTCRSLSDSLLHACPGLRILATSREPLGVEGEVVWQVPPLALPEEDQPASLDRLADSDAVRLFVDRAMAAHQSFRLTPRNASAVARVCQQLDGLPLAIELAAARAAVLPVELIETRLADRFRLLAGEGRSPDPRHQSLRALLDWSFELLSEKERLLLCRLAVFRGGWTRAAAQVVCAGEDLQSGEVLDLLDQLVAKSLVAWQQTGDEARYWLLDTVQAYAWARLLESGEETVQRQRHRDWVLDLAEAAAPALLRSGLAELLERLDREVDNVRAALEWTCTEAGATTDNGNGIDTGLRIAASLWRHWTLRGRLDEGSRWLTELLALADDRRSAARATAIGFAGYFACMRGDPTEGERLGREAFDLSEEIGHASATLIALRVIGFSLWLGGQPARAKEVFEECMARAPAEDLDHRGNAAFFLGELARAAGEPERALVLFEEALALTRELGDIWGTSYVLAFLGHLALDRGEPATAASNYRESLQIRRALGDVHGIHLCLEALGWVAAAQGRAGRAAGLLGAADAFSETYGIAPIAPLYPYRDRAMADARARLGDQGFDASYGNGRRLSADQAVGFALSERRGRLPRPAARRPAPGSPLSPLGPRERQVAALVAQGLSDRRIGETLVISTRTAEKHVANCLAKLGLASRAQLAVWAVQAGLRAPGRPAV